jgi:NADH-quinone oxidoreductase subunit F
LVSVVRRFTEFYEHESCGKCTPCREGGYWLSQIYQRIDTGSGRMEDLELLEDICANIFGRAFCALADGMTSPITASLQYFRDEYVEHIRRGASPFGVEPRRDIATVQFTNAGGYEPAPPATPQPELESDERAERDSDERAERDSDERAERDTTPVAGQA